MDSIVHFELPADNIERAKKFYKDNFGWNIITFGDLGYNMVQTGPTDDKGMHKDNKLPFINGGVLKRQDCIQAPIITILVEDINKSIEKISSSGGKLIKEPFKVGDMGISAYFQDTENNILGLWQPLNI